MEGLAVTATDACSQFGLEVPSLLPETREQLAAVVEHLGTSVNNPVDLGLIGALAPERYMKEAIRIVAKDPNRRFENMEQILRSLSECMEKVDSSRALIKFKRNYLTKFSQDPIGF